MVQAHIFWPCASCVLAQRSQIYLPGRNPCAGPGSVTIISLGKGRVGQGIHQVIMSLVVCAPALLLDKILQVLRAWNVCAGRGDSFVDVQVAGQVLRGLRLWHSSPSPCAACRQPLGSPPECPALRCLPCKLSFAHAMLHCVHLFSICCLYDIHDWKMNNEKSCIIVISSCELADGPLCALRELVTPCYAELLQLASEASWRALTGGSAPRRWGDRSAQVRGSGLSEEVQVDQRDDRARAQPGPPHACDPLPRLRTAHIDRATRRSVGGMRCTPVIFVPCLRTAHGMRGCVGERGVELWVEQRVSGPVPRLRGGAREQPRSGCKVVPCLCHMPRLCLARMRRRGVASACAVSHWVCSCGKGF